MPKIVEYSNSTIEKLIKHGFIIPRNHHEDDPVFIVNVDAIKDKVDSNNLFDFDVYLKDLKNRK